MTKSKSVLNKLEVGQILNLVYQESDYPFHCIVEDGVIYLIEEGVEE